MVIIGGSFKISRVIRLFLGLLQRFMRAVSYSQRATVGKIQTSVAFTESYRMFPFLISISANSVEHVNGIEST